MGNSNESIGIAAEVAIARAFGVRLNPDYAQRADKSIVNLFEKDNQVNRIFSIEKIPKPKLHIAEKQNPVDFILENNKTLSVKTNQKELGKVAPQIVGQPTAETYFAYLKNFFKRDILNTELSNENLLDNYENRSYIFKKFSINNIDTILEMYWNNLFDCDYYIHFFNLKYCYKPIKNYIVLTKSLSPKWNKPDFSFTQSLETWKESNTLKYCDISIGEFQIHQNRNCFKFRFNMKGVMELLNRGII